MVLLHYIAIIVFSAERLMTQRRLKQFSHEEKNENLYLLNEFEECSRFSTTTTTS